jgi:hypothetical protein
LQKGNLQFPPGFVSFFKKHAKPPACKPLKQSKRKKAETRRLHILPRCCAAFCQLSAGICHGSGSGNFRTFLPANNNPASGKPHSGN